MSPERASSRPRWPDDVLDRMSGALDLRVEQFPPAANNVDRQRSRVREACLAAASAEPGLFSLTVPTGGGKTLSSLAFALKHARLHGLQRVIYVVPFTTIIEQNAAAFRNVMRPLLDEGLPDPVIEHHCNLDVGEESTKSRLAAENWDAPLVVTTSVQFYESLFACRTSRCRKLHNLASAVIVLDEVQTLPVDYLSPCLRALQELVRNYGSTVVLCTATQPALNFRDDFAIGLEDVREIVPNPPELYRALRRVRVEDVGRLEDDELSSQLRVHPQVLCIVNTRSHARSLFQALGADESHLHLSALMCPQHRTKILDQIRARLDRAEPVRVVSTQLIEAGVDIDFPVVFRSLAGLDSLAQAAGRCNRNGLAEVGRAILFRAEHDQSEQFFAETANCTAQVLPLYEDPLSLDAIEHYFRLYYWEQSSRWDERNILDQFHLIQDSTLPFLFGFSSVARSFQFIENAGNPVIVPWGKDGASLCEELRRLRQPPGRFLLRRLQRYTVQVPRRIWDRHAGVSIELVQERYPVLLNPELNYSQSLGLCLGAGGP